MNGISQLAQSGDLYGAYDKYMALQNFVKDNRVGLNTVASAVPRRGDKDSMLLADTARDMLGSSFNTEKFILNIGSPYAQETTLGAMFRDGETFKNQSDNYAKAGLSTPVRDIMLDRSEENRDKRDLFGKIVSPLVASQNLSPNRFQLSDYATFLAGNWDGLVEDLGQDGLNALVDDALGNRVSVGTAQTMADVVRNIVRKQTEANPEADRAQLVSAAIREIDRPIRHLPQNSMGKTNMQPSRQTEPSLREIEQGMISSFAREAGTSSANFSARTRKIGDGRWSVQLTAWVYGQCRKLNATAVMDADGNIHYYTD